MPSAERTGQWRLRQHGGLTMTPKTGRPPKTVRNERIVVHLPVGLVSRLNSHIWDPYFGKPRHGARSEVITALLEEAVAALEKGHDTMSLHSVKALLSPPLPGVGPGLDGGNENNP